MRGGGRGVRRRQRARRLQEASKPITAGDVAGRAGCGPGRASVPITAGTRRPCRTLPGDEVRRAPASQPKNPCSERRERGTARALRAEVNVHGWGRVGMREGMEGHENMGRERIRRAKLQGAFWSI